MLRRLLSPRSILVLLIPLLYAAAPEPATAQAQTSALCAACRIMEGDPDAEGRKRDDWMNCAITESNGGLSCDRPNYDQCTISTDENGVGDCAIAVGPHGRVSRHFAAATPQETRLAPLTGGRFLDGSDREEPPAGSPPVVKRHSCTGAIIEKSYAPSRVAEIRSNLRQITI